MKVYALFSQYYNECDSWESIVDLYLTKEDATKNWAELENINTDSGRSYYVQEMEVK